MYRTSNIRKGFTTLVFLSVFSLFSLAQDQDSTVSTPDTAVVVKRTIKGPKVSGTIKDASGKLLSGISVRVGSYSATISDDQGRFNASVPSFNATLQISGQGYSQKEVALKGRGEVEVKLQESPFSSLYSNALLPTGLQPLNHVPYAVSSINSNGAWQSNSETTDSYTQGRISGLNVVRRSGTQGSGADIFLRGFNSISTTNRPLIILDGMIYDNTSYGSSLIGGQVGNPLQFIDVKDIDNITVLKDAAASAYGSKGANGVIVITTSRANELATSIDFAAYSSINVRPSYIPLLQADDYRTYLSDVLKSANYSDAEIQAKPYMNNSKATYFTYHENNTNWQDQIFNRSINQNYFLKIVGGDNVAKYGLSMGYLNNKGIIENTGLKQYNTRFNADLNLTKKLTGNANLSFTYYEQTLQNRGLAPKTSPIYSALVKAPFLSPNIRDTAGAVSPNFAESDIFNVSNPVALVNNAVAGNRNYRFFGIVNFNYDFNKKFRLSTLIGINYDKLRENSFVPRMGVVDDTLKNAIAQSRMSNQVQRLYYLYNDTYLTYTYSNVRHSLLGKAGFRYMDQDAEQDYALGFNSATDQLISVGTGAAALRNLGGEIGSSRWLNNYISLDYGYLNKYFLNGTVAIDASSRFGSSASSALGLNGLRMAVMPSLGVAWLLSSENFMAHNTAVDLLKLRASFGITGNDDIGNYTGRQYYIPQNLLGNQGLVRGNYANPAIRWESVSKANIGIDLSLFNERLNVSLDAYQNRTKNMLTYEPTNTVGAISFAVTNNGAMKTSGLDLGINGRLSKGALKWDAGVNLGTYKTKITKLPFNGVRGDYSQTHSYAGASYITAIGQEANLFYGYETKGVYSTNAEAAAASVYIRNTAGQLVPFTGGDVRFVNNYDSSGDLNAGIKVIDENDMRVIGNPNPDLFGSFNNTITFKRLSLDALFTFSLGNDVYNYTRANLESLSSYNNQTLNVLNRWRADGQVTDVPKASFGDPLGNSRFSDRWIEDGSYLRLRTLALTYDLPVKTNFLKYSKVYVTANNLVTLTKYLGYDPEFSSTNSIFTQGVDTGLEPQFKSFQLGIRVGL